VSKTHTDIQSVTQPDTDSDARSYNNDDKHTDERARGQYKHDMSTQTYTLTSFTVYSYAQ